MLWGSNTQATSFANYYFETFVIHDKYHEHCNYFLLISDVGGGIDYDNITNCSN